ncbi:Regulator of chromosome condensation family protein [Perilla frutescens var. hirtella]|uniref:Regulator of chromosome condensation family protein n=1 Tax=Perilla frutescens var. hirtella TaxID=608512 RepID=A0AAD4ILH2_PERFH|nr:Regulator of chromosome condensation family protein [Perilla frutescens var. hirtella]
MVKITALMLLKCTPEALRSLSFLYGNSQFDNATYTSGGFMPSQTTQIADPSFSPAKSRDTQGLLPLTVKQISEAFQASDDKMNFLIDGVDVNNCGQGSTNDELSPTCVSSLLGMKIDGVAAELWHTIYFFADGDAYAFGGNQFGQLGTGADQAKFTCHLRMH